MESRALGERKGKRESEYVFNFKTLNYAVIV